jgi:hypothetical protein
MNTYSIRLSFTDRCEGPGTGRSIPVTASSMPGAIAKAARLFWKQLNHKQRNDARRDGIKVDARLALAHLPAIPVTGGTIAVTTIRKAVRQLERTGA